MSNKDEVYIPSLFSILLALNDMFFLYQNDQTPKSWWNFSQFQQSSIMKRLIRV